MTTRSDSSSRSGAIDQRLATIRGLLAKAEATTFPAEAEAFLAKASDLMSRYALDEAAVWASTKHGREPPVERRIELRRPYLLQKAALVNAVARVYGCRAVSLGVMRDQGIELVSVVGFAPDLEIVEALVTSLLVQASTAMVAQAPAGLGSSGAAAWRRSFLMGFIDRSSSRLAAAHTAATQDAIESDAATGSGMALALVDRQRDVEAELRRIHPHIRHRKVNVGTSRSGHAAGQSAGEQADLGQRRMGTRRALGAA